MQLIPHFGGQHNMLVMRPTIRTGLETSEETRMWADGDAIWVEDSVRGCQTLTVEEAEHRLQAMKDVMRHPGSQEASSVFSRRRIKEWHDKLENIIKSAREYRAQNSLDKFVRKSR